MTQKVHQLRHLPSWRLGTVISLWTLFVVVVAEAAPSGESREDTVVIPDWEIPKDRWLADGTFYDVDNLSDQPEAGDKEGLLAEDISSELCPPVPAKLPDSGCDVEQCSSDQECQDRQLKCCYNGCVYTCLPELKPAPHFDWIREPRRRLQFGPSWLIPGPDDNIDVEMCSTSLPEESDDADPLVCPHGYECSIDDPGRPEAGIPNRGHCVKMMDVREHHGGDALKVSPPQADLDQTFQADAPIASPPLHHCPLGDGFMLLTGHSVKRGGKKCVCVEAQLKCHKLDQDEISPP